MLSHDIDFFLERDHLRILGQCAHDLLMSHERIGSEMHQFGFAVVGVS